MTPRRRVRLLSFPPARRSAGPDAKPLTLFEKIALLERRRPRALWVVELLVDRFVLTLDKEGVR